jgi:type IV secretion system protein VirD4
LTTLAGLETHLRMNISRGRFHDWKTRLPILVHIVGIWSLTAVPGWAQFFGGNANQNDDLFQPHVPWPVGWRILAILLSALVGLGIGAFFSPLLRQFRKLIFFGVMGLVLLFGLFGPFPIADVVDALAAVIVFLTAIAFGIRLGIKQLAKTEKSPPTSFGSAKWATYDHLTEGGLFMDKGFVLGIFGDNNRSFSDNNRRSQLRYSGARHLLTVAPTRSGKGVSSIIPNLLTHAGSALIVDPKGENALITAQHRGAGLNQNIVLLDPWDIAASRLDMPVGHFNPLDWILAEDPDAAENAFLIADALVISDSTGEARFWDEEAKALLTGIILYVATAEEEAKERHLGRVRDILTMSTDGLKDVLTKMFEHPNPLVSSTASRTATKDLKLLGSVLASAQAQTHFLESPRIRASLATSDFKFEDLKSEPMTVYLILPADRLQTFNRWLRLLIQQAIMVNARNITQKPENPILFMLDEMPALGRLPSIEQAYSLMAGFGMQLWGIVQDLSQLARVYGETGWQTFISNSGVIQYFGSRDKMTAEYFSSLCGVSTIEVHNISWAIGKAISAATGSGGGTNSSWTRTNGVNEAQRQLAYPDELMVLKENQEIIFVENLDPIAAEKVVWYTDGTLRQLGVNLHPGVSAAEAY